MADETQVNTKTLVHLARTILIERAGSDLTSKEHSIKLYTAQKKAHKYLKLVFRLT